MSLPSWGLTRCMYMLSGKFMSSLAIPFFPCHPSWTTYSRSILNRSSALNGSPLKFIARCGSPMSTLLMSLPAKMWRMAMVC